LAQQEAVSSENTIWSELQSVKQWLLDEEEAIRSLELDMKQASGQELEEIMEKYTRLTHDFELHNGFAVKSEITGVLKGLGFSEEEFDKSIAALSGGQKTRVALAKLLLTHPDLIMLDEPTNHLDLNSVEWLEGFLQGYKGAVLVVAHDRYFLDKVVQKVIDIENCRAAVYTGNYSDFSEKKRALRDSMLKAYMNQQAEIQHQEQVIGKLKAFNREKSIKRAESREKLLDKLERLEKPADTDNAMKLKITPSVVSGRDVLQIDNLSKAYPGNPLFSDVTFGIRRGERVAVIGNNGTGKTTLLKILTGLERADSGSFRLGTNVRIGYYDQEHQVLHPDKTLFQEISDEYPEMDNTRIRNTLAAFLFFGDDAFKPVSALSGGERGRLSLAKLMLSNANFLVLDEPTNHLDSTSKEILENALNEYEGTLLYVSHDRYFINQTATRILELEDHSFTGYTGNYDYYLEKKLSLKTEAAASKESLDNISESRLSWQEQKALDAQKRRRENRIKRIEEEIASLEAVKKELEDRMSAPDISTDVEKLTSLSNEAAEKEARLNELYDEWEALNES
ncbi:MAG: ABC-F family ATP-binding cassette domain-containing protein, partial [Lachnospiraceae bacterium]|nr:ABC-F family ATP-binding cassette domain-containing protein [Lachnospiraceae bacterium]